jgi:phospholipase/carboxylesterase
MIRGPVLPPRAGGPPRQLVVLLHGYGADGADLLGLGESLGEILPEALFAAPDAPSRCEQNPFGYEWFPLDFEAMLESVRTGVPTARAAVLGYLEALWAQTGLQAGQTFLTGFSQGAMLAMHAGLSIPEALLGIVSFSGALVPPEGFGSAGAPRTPFCLVHGELDYVVPPGLTRQAAQALAGAGFEVALHFSPGVAHGIAPDGLSFAARFMRARADAMGG